MTNRVEALENVLGELYQVLGELDAPALVLDQVHAVLHDEVLPHETLLPFVNSGSGFGFALKALEDGRKVARTGWNGKGQFVYMLNFSRPYEFLQPCFVLKNAQGLEQPGWVPSMGDMRANDWVLADE